jgi:hypothetical protein
MIRRNLKIGSGVAALVRLSLVMVLACGVLVGCPPAADNGMPVEGTDAVPVSIVIFNPASVAPGDVPRLQITLSGFAPAGGQIVNIKWGSTWSSLLLTTKHKQQETIVVPAGQSIYMHPAHTNSGSAGGSLTANVMHAGGGAGDERSATLTIGP